MLISQRAKRRLLNHFFILLMSLTTAAIIYAVLFYFYAEPQRRIFRLSLTTAYISVILLAATLSFGAWNIFRRRVNPVSSDLRRDLGIWCGIFSLTHTLFGLNVHLQNWTQYFINDSGHFLTDAFGFANYTGVLAALIMIALLITSNDISIRRLGRGRWKMVQRWNYVFALLVAFHGFVYQFVEKRLLPYGFLFGTIVLWIIIIQFAGFWMKRREMKNSDK
ncbi:MAG: ferric reductase-like transmembrane domain-containing protein [Pyrinomonadaceae bacterium]